MDKNYKKGILYGISSYFIWGIVPVYWKQLQHVGAIEILANRFIWSVVFVFVILLFTGKIKNFLQETKAIFSHWKTAACMILAAVAITFNWGIFIWAVEVGRIVETSMGYYINPLVSVLIGMVVLRERLDKLQLIAVICAAAGIGVIIFKNGSLPWVSVGLAATFAFYGLLKKIIVAEATTSIMLETLLITPIAAGYIYYLGDHGGNAFQTGDILTWLFLAGSGAVTATPLLLFTACAKILPLKIVGFMQYISPCMTLTLGTLVYGEPFTTTHAIAFGCIWVGLAFFTWSQLRR